MLHNTISVSEDFRDPAVAGVHVVCLVAGHWDEGGPPAVTAYVPAIVYLRNGIWTATPGAFGGWDQAGVYLGHGLVALISLEIKGG